MRDLSKKTKTMREREIPTPLPVFQSPVVDWRLQKTTRTVIGIWRLVEANSWVINYSMDYDCVRENLWFFSFSIWRDLVKGFFSFSFLERLLEMSYSYTAISFWFFVSSDSSFGVFLTMAIIRCCKLHSGEPFTVFNLGDSALVHTIH